MTADQSPKRTADDQDVYYAEKLIEFYGQELIYVPEWVAWYHYTGAYWRRDNDQVMATHLATQTTRRLLAARIALADYEQRQAPDGDDGGHSLEANRRARGAIVRAAQMQTSPKIRSIVELARANPEIVRHHEALDNKPWLLACKNGTLDLKSGAFRKNSPGDLLTKGAPVNFNGSDVAAPGWEQFIARVLPDPEVRGFMQRYFGYCLTGDVGVRLFVVLHGSGANGKTVFLEVMQRILGAYAVVAPPSLLMAKKFEAHPAETAVLHGARLAISSEVRKGRTFDEEAVKRLTGNDTISTRRMHENYWDFVPTHKLVLATNHRPRVLDTSEGFWDRLALVPFEVRIPEEERIPDLQGQLVRSEGAGILAWAYRGLQDYLANGMRVPDSVRHNVAEYRAEEDRLGQFIAEKCELGGEYRESNASLSAAVRDWAVSGNFFVPSPHELRERLKQIGCKPFRSEFERGWAGIRIVKVETSKMHS